MKKIIFFTLFILINVNSFVVAQAPCYEFAPAVNYSSGTMTRSITTNDFNGDGIPDLITTNWGDDNVAVFLGVGDGTFGLPTYFNVGQGAIFVSENDFNGDGFLDLVVSNALDNTLSILLGNGDGTFNSQVTYPVGLNPTIVAIADFDGDGELDLAIVNAYDNTVSVLLGNGDGTFNIAVDYTVGLYPFSIITNNFNGDGFLDLAIINSDDNTVSILLGNGDGTFNTPVNYNVGFYPTAISNGDFNGDGFLDIVTANNGDNTVSILLGNGDGTFGVADDYIVGAGVNSVAIGDFNEDGFLDLITANTADNTVSILSGNGDGTFGVAEDYIVGTGAISVKVGDFNGDGHLDFATANVLGDNMSVILQQPIIHYATIAPAVCVSYTSPSGLYTWNTSGTYQDTIQTTMGCDSVLTINLTVNDLPIVQLGVDTIYCQGEIFSMTLDAQNVSATYEWHDGSINQTFLADTAGVYFVHVIDTNNCAASDTLIVVENPLPIISLGGDVFYCQNENFSMTLNAQNVGSTYAWNDGSINQILAVDTAGTYFVEVTTVHNCTASDTIIITENTPPTVTANASATTLCIGDTLVLTGSGALTYTWDNGVLDSVNTFPTDTTIYTVIGIDANNCADTTSITINVNPKIQPIFTDLGPFCEGENFILSDTSINNIAGMWSPAIDNINTETYTFTPNENECATTETMTVIINEKPVVDLGSDILSCNSKFSTVLDAENVGSTYFWNDSTTNQTLTTNGFGIYSVIVTNAFNCSDTGTISISAGDTALVTGDIKAKMRTQCLFEFYVEDAGAVETFEWSFGTVTQQDTAVTHIIEGYGEHEITVTMSNACDTITKSIIVSCNPDFILYPNPASTDVTIENHLGVIMNQIQIIDNTGKVVFIVNPNATTINFDISHLANAVYTVRIETEQGRVMKKLEVMK